MNKKALKKQHIYIFSIFLNPYDLITMISIQQKVFKIIYLQLLRIIKIYFCVLLFTFTNAIY